ncbi:hypothetical protein [Emticicia soli]|uniref:Uncharacterized protein n=1 Tax=Emticicia soli TaxID=2027878 RepID=A0ABW5JGY1_9BACT
MTTTGFIFWGAILLVGLYFLIVYLGNKSTEKDTLLVEQMRSNFENKIKEYLSSQNFVSTRQFILYPLPEHIKAMKGYFYKPFAILADETNKKFAFVDESHNYSILNFSEIKSVDIKNNMIDITKSETSKQNSLGRAVVGGAIAGGTGAVVGALTAKEITNSQTESKYSNSTITIITKDLDKPILRYQFGIYDLIEGEKWISTMNLLIEKK